MVVFTVIIMELVPLISASVDRREVKWDIGEVQRGEY